ncbi:exported chitinase [Frondihabitans sucicola]|uniref:Exported chitinase n=1 Tax=Frondihabitans sucicola TaxID=1268041 RepID=A0ABM8GMQ6_9MICO|nr:chitinase [Frondihabitans sucicola]BDZ49694.1 exported chitinase [Frondihabitans sucicola]
MTVTRVDPTPVRRLSILRLFIAVVVTAGVVVGGLFGYQLYAAQAAGTTSSAWFGGYVDVTATPTYAFESPATNSGKQTVLSFVVASSADSCTPSWGAAYSLQQASDSLDLDRRIARLQQQGGDVTVSFGGQANTELAVACTSVSQLAAAYASVIDRYDLTTVDLDVEGTALQNVAANARRAEALALLQKERRAEGKPLAIWLTLPVTPDGLSVDGQKAVKETLAKKVDLAGVNAMTMDYGSSLAAGSNMAVAAEDALTATHRQLGILYGQTGTTLTSRTLWSKIGATPMIGQNDDADEVFTLKNATALNAFAVSKGVGRMSMWSLNRDVSCGSNYTTLTVVSDSCSGVDQHGQHFATLLGKHFKGTIDSLAGTVTTPEPVSSASLKDNPKTSPYPIWSADNSYLEGTKIVWHRNVYEAKWWTQGDVPDNPVLNSWQTPWQLVGPVLKGEKPVAQPTLPAGTYPNWDGTTAFTSGARVLFEGTPYQAKWWTQGDSPAAASSNPDSSPWVPLTLAQIAAVKASAAPSSPAP